MRPYYFATEVLPTVEEDDVWIADRNFCTLKFLFGIAAQKGYFIIRQHKSLPWQATDDFRTVGQIDTGEVSRAKHPFERR